MAYNLVVCGGTFDHFHKGHREYLKFVLSLSKKVLVGITSDKYIHCKKKDAYIESYVLRRKSVENFLERVKGINKTTIAPIDSLYMPTIWDKLPIEAIIVSKNTTEGARLINKKRAENGLPPLRIIIMPQVSADGTVISSSLIREGKINREGVSYLNSFVNKTFILPDKLRAYLKKPFGRLCHEGKLEKMIKNSRLTVTVGDVTSAFFNKKNLRSNISVVDLAVGRKKIFENIADLGFEKNTKIIQAVNPPGFVTKSLVDAVAQGFVAKEKAVIAVNGEEDLAVLPVILISPLGARVFYGQPDKGIVLVDITENTKDRTYKILRKFRIS